MLEGDICAYTIHAKCMLLGRSHASKNLPIQETSKMYSVVVSKRHTFSFALGVNLLVVVLLTP